MSVQSFFLINAAPKPLLIKEAEIAINTLIIPIKPNSLGKIRRANIIPITKVMPFWAKLSMKLQIRPEVVFCLSVVIK